MTHRMPVPVAGPWITQREIDYAADAAATAWYGNANSYHVRFEEEFATHTGRTYAMALPSCTSGLHLALLALGVGPGDSVVVPDLTWIATAAPISYVGATPRFADVHPDTWCITGESLESVVDDSTRAVIAVDLYGGMCDMTSLGEVCSRRGIALIEDAAEAAGAEYQGRPAGSFGTASVFSFHGSKTVTTGEGGMVLCDDAELFERMSFLRDHGRRPGDTQFLNEEVAYKYKMSALQAAVGLAQIERIDELVGRKRQIFAWYEERLGHVYDVTLNAEPAGVRNAYWMITALLAGLDKRDVGEALGLKGIQTRPFFSPLSSLAAYAESTDSARARGSNRVAYELSPRGINLPSALCLEEGDVDFVCRELISLL